MPVSTPDRMSECEAFPPSPSALAPHSASPGPHWSLKTSREKMAKSRQPNVIKKADALCSAALHKWHSDRYRIECSGPICFAVWMEPIAYLAIKISGAGLRTVRSIHADCHHRSPSKEIRTTESHFLSMPALRMHTRRPKPKRYPNACKRGVR
jgi:hypothetical protein